MTDVENQGGEVQMTPAVAPQNPQMMQAAPAMGM